jgi:predicted phosphodiesterase
METALIIPDCHIPYEDKRAYQLMLDIATDLNPDEIIILGDYADFYAINSHGKDADKNHLLMDEVHEVIERLKGIKSLFPRAKKVYIEGNHEYRLARYVASKCPDLYGAIDVASILELKLLGFEFVPYGPTQQYHVLGTGLVARHEPLGGGVHVAHNSLVKGMSSIIFGHTHRLQKTEVYSLDGKRYVGISSGWLGNKHHSVFEYVKTHHQWGLGFSVARAVGGILIDVDLAFISPTYNCIFDGYWYQG